MGDNPAVSGSGADPWSVLGLPGTATVAQAERAWRRLARRHHPDAVGGSSEAQAAAAEHMARLNAAIAAIRADAPSARDGDGWWHGAPPDDGHDWFGFPLRDDAADASDGPGAGPGAAGPPDDAERVEGATPPPPVPAACPACDAPVADLEDLRTHLRDAHGIGEGRRRPVVRVLDGLGALAWRVPVPFALLLAALSGLAAGLWLHDVVDPDDPLWPIVSPDGGMEELWLLPWVAFPTVVVGVVLWVLVDRHRHRLELTERLRRRAAARRTARPGRRGPGG